MPDSLDVQVDPGGLGKIADAVGHPVPVSVLGAELGRVPTGARHRVPPGLRERKQLTVLYLGGELALAGLPEPDLAAGQQVLSGVDLGTPRATRQLLYVTGRGAWHGTADIGPRTGSTGNAGRTINLRWGGWGSNPRPAIMRSPAWRSGCATCTDTTKSCRRWP